MGEEDATAQCALKGHVPFESLWRRAQQAVAVVYEGTSLQDLIDEERMSLVEGVYEYYI